jgi:hypothetical protein
MSQPPGDAIHHRLAQALEHPVRADFLRLLANRQALSPSEALPLLSRSGPALANVVYHVRVLGHLELVEPVGEPTPRGGRRFQPTEKGRSALLALGIPPDESWN